MGQVDRRDALGPLPVLKSRPIDLPLYTFTFLPPHTNKRAKGGKAEKTKLAQQKGAEGNVQKTNIFRLGERFRFLPM